MLPIVPNLSGTHERCGNCRFSVVREVHVEIVKALAARELLAGRPAPQVLPEDDCHCNENPAGTIKKTWGWCGRWQARKSDT